MTDRRRNLFILAARRAAARPALAVIIRGSPHRRRRARASTSRAASSLVYQAQADASSAEVTPRLDPAHDRHHARARRPARRRRARDPALGQRPDRRRRCPTSRTPSRPSSRSARPRQLCFYDWETNVLGPGRQAATPTERGGHRRLERRPARRRHARPTTTRSRCAAKCPADQRARRHDHDGALLRRRRQGQDGRSAGRRSTRGRRSRGLHRTRASSPTARSSRSRRARRRPGRGRRRPTRPRQAPARTPTTSSSDDPALRGHGHQEPAAELRQRRRRQRAARRHLRLHRQRPQERGRRRHARRSPSAARPALLPGVDRADVAQHFAIVARQRADLGPVHRLRSRTPTASTARNGSQISGSFTIKSAQRPRQPAARPARCRSSSS